MTEAASPKKSDLPVRAVSAVVMVALAGAALWLGGPVWAVFVALISAGVLVEWSKLVLGFAKSPVAIVLWHLAGLAYVGLACFTLLVLRSPFFGPLPVLVILGTVVAVDIWAYFFGRQFGGAKIAPAISPSKTWSGLVGGMAGAALWLMLFTLVYRSLGESGPGPGSPLETMPIALSVPIGIPQRSV